MLMVVNVVGGACVETSVVQTAQERITPAVVLTKLDLVVIGCPSLVGQSNESVQVLLV